LSEGPAQFAGLAARKGAIKKGLDADLVIWDPDQSFEVTPERLFFRHKLSPYLGRTLQGLPVQTLLRAQLVYDGVSHPAGPIGKPLLHRS
jgi:allantoinase